MGVPGKTAERGELRRPRLGAFATLVFAVLIYLWGPTSPPRVAQPRAGDCVELHLWTNGFHTDIAAPVDIFPPEHPLRRLFPGARAFLIGWGDEKFYRADVFDWGLALDAIVPPSPSAMHVAYDAAGAARYLGPTDNVAIAVSREGAAGLVAYVDRTLALDAEGAPIRVAPGKLIGRSAFLRARGSFHLFNVCNQWMARALRAAGLNVNAHAAWMGDWLIREVRRERPEGCPHSPNAPSRPI
jgi:uncharacterized protein (TIGR02117 family)